MNDKEREEKFKTILDNVITKFADNPQEFLDSDKLQIKYNKVLKEKIKLQSNWNSLREWLKNKIDNFQDDVSEPILHEQMTMRVIYEHMENLDKMNELEGKVKE